jgi:hypothetical protein
MYFQLHLEFYFHGDGALDTGRNRYQWNIGHGSEYDLFYSPHAAAFFQILLSYCWPSFGPQPSIHISMTSDGAPSLTVSWGRPRLNPE